MEKPYTEPDLETVCDIAHDHGVPVDPAAAGASATEAVSGLRREAPRVFVGADSLPGAFTVNPTCLTDEETEYVCEHLRAHFDR